MKTAHKFGLGALVLFVLALSVFWLAPKPAEDGDFTAGSVTGPDVYSDYFNINGVTRYYSNVVMPRATTTLCSIKSPSATSTLDYFSLIVNTGTSTAALIDVGTSVTNNTSTSTALFIMNYSIASTARGSVVLPGELPSTATSTILAPNTYVNAKTQGAGLAGYTYKGTCNAVFTTL